MGLTRNVGKTEKFPNHFIELFYDQKKQIIGRAIYDRTDCDSVLKQTLTKEERKELDLITKKDLALLKGDEFNQFIEERKHYRKQIKDTFSKANDDTFTFSFGDTLYEDGLFIASYNKDAFGRSIMVMENEDDFEFACFNKEELSYPVVLFFLRSSIKANKVSLFIMTDKMGKDYIIGMYRTGTETYLAFVDDSMENVIEIKAYDDDYNEKNKESNAHIVKEAIENFLYKREIVLKAQKYLPQIEE